MHLVLVSLSLSLCASIYVCVYIRAGTRLAMEVSIYKDASTMLYELQFGGEILEIIWTVTSCNKTMHGAAATDKFTPPQKTSFIHWGWNRFAKYDSHAAWEATKIYMFLTEHGKLIVHFCNPSRLIFMFLAEHARLNPVCLPIGDFSVQLAPHYSRRGQRLREFTQQTPSN